jgi:hypothetical protein
MKKIAKHLAIMALCLVVIGWLVFKFLAYYTKHNEPMVQVPNVEGLNYKKAIDVLQKGGFDYEFTDTVFRENFPLMAIIDQTPIPEFEVKKGRKIYLVINTDVIPDVEVPNLANTHSYDQAVRLLRTRGLTVGRKIKRPMPEIKDPNSEPVLALRLAGDSIPIKSYLKVKRGTKIDLVVGSMIIDLATDSTTSILTE